MTAIDLTRTPVRRYRFWRVHPRLTIAAVVIIIAALVFAVIRYVVPHPVPPVYVTDGSHVFSENLGGVEKLIQQENQRVTSGNKPYVSVAFADLLTARRGVDALPEEVIRHDLEGAYVAQLTWNRPVGNPPGVLVRLLLADQGSQERNWSEAANALADRISGGDRLVAVAGLGISFDNTRRMIDALATHKLGLVAAALTGDNMTVAMNGGGPVSGMVRIAPTNSNEAEAAVKYLDGEAQVPDHAAILLVQDQNRADEYAASLGTAFTRSLAAGTTRGLTLVKPDMAYDSGLAEAGMILGASAERVCTAHADVIYFAGREPDLQGFLRGLATRSCAAHHLTVISGDAISHLEGQSLWQGNDANLTVVFTALAHPDMWTKNPQATTSARAERFGSCGTCFRGVFPEEPPEALEDGGAIMSHDAIWTAIKAIEYTRNTTPSAGAVAQALTQLRIDLASGWICSFNADHNPTDKALPIMQIDQSGALHYQTLSSPQGHPPTTCPS